MPSAVVLVVGDEILQGHTQDTNSHYLAQRLGARGVEVRRILVVPDDVDEIALELERFLVLAPDFIFVSGGIGPTPDDRTYEAVAIALGRPLVLDPADEAWLKARIERTGYGRGLLDDLRQREGMLRMVRRPEGSEAIENPVGAALGSLVRLGTTVIVVLPGVPKELRAMMDQKVEPRLFQGSAPPRAMAELIVEGEEAALWGLLRELELRYPAVRLGSYPQEAPRQILLRVQGEPRDVDAVVGRLAKEVGARPRTGRSVL